MRKKLMLNFGQCLQMYIVHKVYIVHKEAAFQGIPKFQLRQRWRNVEKSLRVIF